MTIRPEPGSEPDPIGHHRDRRRAGSFGEDAEGYDRARPSYPAALFDELVAGAGAEAGGAAGAEAGDGGGAALRVLDVGCGTGIAARPFVARGCRVLGVEHDERMAITARSHGLAVEVASFESWERRGRLFDLVVSAQAWHWIDPEAGAARAAEALRPGGRWAGFWNLATHAPDAQAALDAVYRRVAPELQDDAASRLRTMHPPLVEAELEAFAATGCFDAPEARSYPWSRRYSTRQWLDQLGTHSHHRVLPAAVLAELLDGVGLALDGLGGSIEVGYQTVVHTLRRNDGPLP